MQHSTIRKTVCGILAALLITAVPLTALADEQAPEQTAPASVESGNVTPPATPVSPEPAPATPAPAPAPASTPGPSPAATPAAATTDKPADQPAAQVAPAPAPTPSPSAGTSLQTRNNVNSAANSGNASVTANRDAGDATSGDASATATVLNLANASGVTADSFQTFQCDITRDLQQNITIDPASLKPLPECTDGGVRNGTALQQSAAPGGSGSLQNGSSLVNILNDIVLSAASGNASVDNNRDAGNATSGDATALANVVNIANSAISARNSFLGVINIYGQLKGDILVPQSFVDGLMSGTAAGSGNVNNTTISNNLNAAADSGNATVANNRTGGNATTGDATTNLTVLNLTGQEVVAKNSLLVFVNVLGKWMGMIVPAPGTNTAMLGSGVQSGQGLLPAGANTQQGADQDITTNITNNIRVAAQSGDANVSDNRTAGNATSGSAKAGVNLLNVTDSNFWLEDWFGALFINVLGSWLGDFDIQSNAPTDGSASGNPSQPVQGVKVFKFTEPASVSPANNKPASNIRTAATDSTTTAIADSAPVSTTGQVLESSTVEDQFTPHSSQTRTKFDFLAMAAVIAALTMLTAVVTALIKRHFAA